MNVIKFVSSFSLPLIMCLIIGGCSVSPTETPDPSSGLELALDQYLKRDNFLTGVVDLKVMTELSFQSSGRVQEVLVEEGDSVKSGDPIARLESNEIELMLDRAKAALKIAEANLSKTIQGPHQAIIDEAESEVEAISAVTPVGITQEAIQEANLKGAQARLDYLLAQPFPEDVAIVQAEVDKAQAEVDEAQSKLDHMEIVAPVGGSVIRLFTQAFEYTGDGDPVVVIGDERDLIVRSIMSELDIAGLKIGDQLRITYSALPELESEGKVISISPEMDDPNGIVFLVVIALEEVPDSVRWGMTAQIHFP
jgi:multidrug resistance efflux pump